MIEGGNHAGFGSYGAQRGDGTATISAQEQQDQAAQAIVAFAHDIVDVSGPVFRPACASKGEFQEQAVNLR